jgi:hypothetical protein
MGAPRPCLGYSSSTAAVLAPRKQGESTETIAARVGITANKMLALESSAGRYKKRPDPIVVATDRALLLPLRLLQALAPHAYRRGTKPTMLAFAIIETVIADDMVNAVLYDQDEASHA